MNKALGFALFAAAVLALAGCASSNSKAARQKNPGPCPNVVVLEDAGRLVDFDGDETLENVAYTGEILDTNLTCRYYGDKPIEASLKLDMAFGRGPKGKAEKHEYTYFVAVTRKDLEVIEKAEFKVPVEFSDKKNVRTTEEKIGKIVIPRASDQTSGTNFEIVVGFSLNPQEVIFNRSGKSLKFPELK